MKHLYLGILLYLIANNIAQAQAPVISYQTPQIYQLNSAITPLTPTNTGGAVPATIYGQVSTFAGSGASGSNNGTGTAASFNSPVRSTFDLNGNLCVIDRDNNQIRRITPAGVVSTFVGGFNQPNGIVADAFGSLFITDAVNNAVKKITSGGIVNIVAGGSQGTTNGPASSSSFYYPFGIDQDAAGNFYVADTYNNLIRKINTSATVSTVAGTGGAGANNGAAAFASFNHPNCIKADATGNLYLTDPNNNVIRKISTTGIVTTFAGTGAAGATNGPAATATFTTSGGLCIDNVTGTIYVADLGNNLIRKIDASGNVSTLAGSGQAGAVNGTGATATFNKPNDVEMDGKGYLFVCDVINNMIRKVCVTGYTIDKALPAGLIFDATTGTISGKPTITSPATNYTITAYNLGGSSSAVVNIKITEAAAIAPPKIVYQTPQVYKVKTTITPLAPTNSGGPVTATAQVSTFAGGRAVVTYDSQGTDAGFNLPSGIVTDAAGNIYVSDYGSGAIRKITPAAVVTTISNINTPSGLAIDNQGNLFISDFQDNYIYKLTPAGVKSIFAGKGSPGATNGTGTAASFSGPGGIVADASGNIYVADQANNLIRKITNGGLVTTLAGNGSSGSVNGTGTAASFNNPDGLTVDGSGNIFVADTKNNLIRKITPAGLVTTLAGNGTAGNIDGAGTAATFNYPTGITVDAANNLYVVDYNNNEVRMITPPGVVTTIAGNGSSGNINGAGQTARFRNPLSAAFDPSGNLYITDYLNYIVRKLTFTTYTINKILPAGLVFNTTTGIITGTPTVTSPASDYTITASNASGSSSTVVNITVLAENPVIMASAITKSTCDADYNPAATGGLATITYTSSNTAIATIVNGEVHILSAGTSIINATDGTTTAQQTLTVKPTVIPLVSITADNTNICAGAAVNYTATINNHISTVNYQWQLNGINVGTNANIFTTNTITAPTDKVQCIVTRTDSCLVTGASNIYSGIVVNPFITPSVTIQSTANSAICSGTPVTFTAIPTNGGTMPTYQWQVNSINAGTNTSSFTTRAITNGDAVTCTITNNDNKCTTATTAKSDPITISVIADPVPSVTISASINNVYYGTPITFTATVANTTATPSYQWQVNGVNDGINAATYTNSNLKNGSQVTCVVTFNSGCTVSVTGDAVIVKIIPPPTLIIPNTFTPNGDSVNDVWNIANISQYTNCTVNIYNRNGGLVYRSVGYAIPWDGVYNKKLLPVGTYYYIIDLKNKTALLKGSITIIR